MATPEIDFDAIAIPKEYMGILKLFESKEIIEDDIGKKIILPKTEKPAIEILSNEEVSMMLDCYSTRSNLGRRNRAIIHVMSDCGLRAEEVANLKYDDINFEQRYIKVLGKGRKQRIISIGRKTLKIIMDYTYKRRMVDEDVKNLFIANDSQPMTVRTVKQMFNNMKKKSGIVRVYAHLLRHTFVTNFLLYGIGDVYQLSKILGHSDVQTTEKYLHIANYYQMVQKQRRKSVSYFDTFY